MTNKAIWLPVALIAAAAVGLMGLLVATDGAKAGGSATVSVSGGTVAPGGNITVDVNITPTGTLVGAADVQVDYDPAVLTPTACTPAASCNTAFDANTVAFSLADLAGLTGVEGTITFNAIGAAGTSSALTVVVTACSDETGTTITCTPQNSTVNVQQPTASPSPSPAPTASPTGTAGAGTATPTGSPTPAGLPPTGGSDGDSSSIGWVLAALGIAAVAAAGWATMRLRRVNS
jgi:hypothetical protein